MKMNLITLCVIVINIHITKTARILCLFPAPFYSHQTVFKILTEELVKYGHNLVIMTPSGKAKSSENITIIDVQDVSNRIFKEKFSKAHNQIKKRNAFSIDQPAFIDSIQRVTFEVTNAQFSEPEMRALIEDKTHYFDLLLIEDCIRMAFSINARFNTSLMTVSSMNSIAKHFQTVGAETNVLFFPDRNGIKGWDSNLSPWNKMYLIYTFLTIEQIISKWEKMYNVFIRKHFPESTLSFQEIGQNVESLFLNMHHIWDNNRPVTPAVVYMGAIQLKRSDTLSDALKKYLDDSQRGVIYMSLGSKIKSSDLPSNLVNIITNVFASLSYDIIWKWDTEELPNKPPNVFLQKWLPQNALLQHPSVKLFITQAGLQSSEEAIDAGVPLIGLPIFADQFVNAAKYKQLGIGVQLDIDKLNENIFKNTIMEVLEERRYRENVIRLSNIMRDHRLGGLQRTIHMIEYIRKHGAKHLHSPLAGVSNAEFFMIDILIILSILVILGLIVICFTIKRLIIKLFIY